MSEARPSVTIRMTYLLKKEIEAKAKADMRSLNAEIVHLLSLAVTHGKSWERWDKVRGQIAERIPLDQEDYDLSEQLVSPLERALLRLFREMGEEERRTLRAVAEIFAIKKPEER